MTPAGAAASRPLPLPLPDPPLHAGDLVLRPWASEDAPALAAAWADPLIQRWTGVPERRDVRAAERWIAGEADRRARGVALDLVVVRADAVVGEVGLSGFDRPRSRAEVGWWVAEAHRGHGVGASAVSALAGWALEELAVDVLEARCASANPASGGLARAAGFDLVEVHDGVERWQRVGPLGATLHL